MRRLVLFILKVTISALLLYFASIKVDLASAAARLGDIDPVWIAVMIFVLFVQLFLVALRWRDVGLICGGGLSRAKAVRYSLIAMFFNQILPSTVGGDAARAWLFARDGAGWSIAIYSVLVDRIVGVTTLAALVFLCLPWTLQLVSDPVARAALALVGVGVIVGVAFFLSLASPRLAALERIWPFHHLAATSRLCWRVIQADRKVAIAALSFAIHLSTVAVFWCGALAVHASVSFPQLLFVILPVLLISAIPISIAGWGVRESLMVAGFFYAGLVQGDGLVVSIIFGVATLAMGAIGGVVWIASGYRLNSMTTPASHAGPR